MLNNNEIRKGHNTSYLPPIGGEFTRRVVLISPNTPLGRVARNVSAYFLPRCNVSGLIARSSSLIGLYTIFWKSFDGISCNADKFSGSGASMSSYKCKVQMNVNSPLQNAEQSVRRIVLSSAVIFLSQFLEHLQYWKKAAYKQTILLAKWS